MHYVCQECNCIWVIRIVEEESEMRKAIELVNMQSAKGN